MKQQAGPFFYERNLQFSLCVSQKKLFLPQSNTTLSVQKPNYRIDLKVSANWDNLQWYRLVSGFLAPKNTDRKPPITCSQLTWPLELHMKQRHCLWLAVIFFALRCAVYQSCVWLTDSVFLIKDHFSIKCHSYVLYQSQNRERKISVFENGKIEDYS